MKDKYEEEELDEYENELLKNSRLSVLYAVWQPLFCLCFITSVIYVLYGVLFWGVLWLGLAFYCARRINKFKKKIIAASYINEKEENL